jgi:hypothetical protein
MDVIAIALWLIWQIGKLMYKGLLGKLITSISFKEVVGSEPSKQILQELTQLNLFALPHILVQLLLVLIYLKLSKSPLIQPARK